MTTLDLTAEAATFPAQGERSILRDAHLLTLREMTDGAAAVSVVGSSTVGKTTFLAQFANQHAGRTFSVFIRPGSRLSYDRMTVMLDFLRQFHVFLGEVPSEDPVPEIAYRRLLLAVQRQARREPVFFILDGVDAIPERDTASLESLLDLLPIGAPGVRTIVGTGNPSSIPTPLLRCKAKEFRLGGFSLLETERFVHGLSLKEEQVRECYTLTRGNPGKLASIRRILLSGTAPDALLALGSRLMDELCELEWRAVSTNDVSVQRLLALVAFEPAQYSLEVGAKLLSLSENTVATVQGAEFIHEDDKGRAVYKSEAMREFASRKLAAHRKEIQSAVITSLLDDPRAEGTIRRLPGDLYESGRHEDLLGFLTAEYFDIAFDQYKSVYPLRKGALLGFKAALGSNRDPDAVRFALQRSALADLGYASTCRAQVDALFKMGEVNRALAVAQGAVLAEDRLHLLAVLARLSREDGLAPAPELLDQIRQVYLSVDKKALGERAIDIARDLIYSLPDLASELVAQVPNHKETHPFELTEIYLVARNRGAQDADARSAAERIGEHFGTRKGSVDAAARVLLSDLDGSTLRVELEKIDDRNFRFALLRQWISFNRRREDATQVMEWALQHMLATAEYTPTARDLRQVASALPYAPKPDCARIIKMFDGLKDSARALGPTVEYLQLQLLLAEAAGNAVSTADMVNRVVESYYYCVEQSPHIVRCEALAHLLSFLARHVTVHELVREGLDELAREELSKLVQSLLPQVAEQTLLFSGVLSALAVGRLDIARALAAALNTEYRRDAALETVVNNAVHPAVSSPPVEELLLLTAEIVAPSVRAQALGTLLLDLRKAKVMADRSTFVALARAVEGCEGAAIRCYASCDLLQLPRGPDITEEDVAAVRATMSSSLDAINAAWGKVSIAYDLAAALARHEHHLATDYLHRADRVRAGALIQTDDQANAYVLCLQLAISAHAGMYRHRIDTEQDVFRLGSLIDALPSPGDRAILWSGIALNMYLARRLDDFARIVRERVRPELSKLSSDDSEYRNACFIHVAPILYRDNPVLAKSDLKGLSPQARDDAFETVAWHLVQKRGLYDPYTPAESNTYDITYEDAVQICDLLPELGSDDSAFAFIRTISRSLTSPSGSKRCTKQQREVIAVKLDSYIASAYPNTRFIKHEGYRIVSEAQVARLRESRQWEPLVRRAKAIPNSADSAFVLTLIADALPSRENTLRSVLLNEAFVIVKGLPSAHDRHARARAIVRAAVRPDPRLAQAVLRWAFERGNVLGVEERTGDEQKQLIDLAYRMDPEFARKLVSSLDDDEARDRRREALLKDRMSELEARGKLGDSTKAVPSSKLPAIAWETLGLLNAGQMPPTSAEYMRSPLTQVADIGLNEGYPVLALAIGSACAIHSEKSGVTRHVRPLFDGLLLTCEIVQSLLRRASSVEISAGDKGDTLIFGPGERERGLEFVERWLRTRACDEVRICDPYFGLDELPVLRWMPAKVKRITVLTWRSHVDKSVPAGDYDDAFLRSWRLDVSAAEPPSTLFLLLSTKQSKQFPIHDRWLLGSDGTGLRLGTSIGGIGSRVSEVSEMTGPEVYAVWGELDEYIRCNIRTHKGEAVQYLNFTL
ncbi:MAG: hypothetical protein V4850_36355 [Myxococcota bacterium]